MKGVKIGDDVIFAALDLLVTGATYRSVAKQFGVNSEWLSYVARGVLRTDARDRWLASRPGLDGQPLPFRVRPNFPNLGR